MISDPCYQNGDCDHICIPVNSSDGTLTGKKCVCKTGYYLREDKKTCAGEEKTFYSSKN